LEDRVSPSRAFEREISTPFGECRTRRVIDDAEPARDDVEARTDAPLNAITTEVVRFHAAAFEDAVLCAVRSECVEWHDPANDGLPGAMQRAALLLVERRTTLR
jgi:hypothetical protein